jgi:hypothetical protein
MERSVKGEALGPGRKVVQLEFTDQPAGSRHWWFLHEDGGTQLCYEDPGFEVDAYLRSSVRDMILIVRGDLPLHAALAEERLDVAGPSSARRWLPGWFNLGPLAAVRSERAGASPRGTRRSAH